MVAVAEKPTKRWTYEEYYRLDDEKRYEIIDGELLMAPSADTWHQSWSVSLLRILDAHVLRGRLGRVFHAPLDVILDTHNVVQPDLLFISKANAEIIQRRAVFGAPDLLVELLLPSSIRRDRYRKKEIYARFGVKEYWIGDPANKSLEVFMLKGGKYELHCLAEEKGEVTSLVLPRLKFDIADVR